MINYSVKISLLALPSAFKAAGWILTTILLVLFGLAASSSAKMLIACQRMHLQRTGSALLTYGDIGEAAFGRRGRWFIQSVFFCELFCASVALFILAADSVYNLLPDDTTVPFNNIRLIVWAVLTVTTWPRSLNLLSWGSLVGILCLLSMVAATIFDGVWNRQAPGSLWEPAPTYFLPKSWIQMPFAIGLCMAGYAGEISIGSNRPWRLI